MRTIDMCYPYVDKSAIKEVEETLRGKWIGQAHKVDYFEETLNRQPLIMGGHSVAVNSGSSALELAYDLIGLKEGDEVITTPLTCTATNIPLVRRKCKLVFADIDRKTLLITEKTIKEKLTKNTKAVVVVGLGGIVAEDIKLDIPVVYDNCQAFPYFQGDYTAFSFQAIKTITTGDGGALICKNKKDAEKAKLWRWFGIDRKKKLSNDWSPYKNRAILFDIEFPGYKYQMNDIAASIGIANLKKHDKLLMHREDIFEVYKEHLKDTKGVKLIDSEHNVYWLSGLLVDDRESFCEHLKQSGIETNVMHVRNDVYKIFKPFKTELPNMDWVDERYIYIPIHNKMTIADAIYITKIINLWSQKNHK